MAQEEITVTHFDITRCGYYTPYARKDAHLFGSAESMLKDLAAWAAGRSLATTQTYGFSNELLPAYLLDVRSAKDEYLVCTWNRTADVSGNVLSVPGGAKVGAASASAAKLPPGNIAGYPSYFWFRPKENRFSTVQFAGTLNGRQNLIAYTSSFLQKFNPQHVIAKHDANLEAEAHKCIEGYQESPDAGEYYTLEDAMPSFESVLVRNAGVVAKIRKDLDRVHTIIRKETIRATTAAGKSHLDGVLGFFGVEKAKASDNDYRVSYKVKYKPSEQEFDKMVEQYQEFAASKWDDIGFLMSGRSSPVWLSGSVARTKSDVEVVRKDNVVDTQQLLTTLQLHRKVLLKT
ncbi:hypothetical protein [Burkholderia vietnamiensis]|uniref:hypothetical protein n=1 Tax=Burkholderia vietnamiensis TaxID=60552 RepID=UPI00158C1266|nr:hypothetical protein [Burkholderia vietnamiensis]HDR9081408.1 hypothetical protein [Burkholderia vietnamiensis]